jgi:murein DD-endopeptidase MepM/ murein hydrolase activator NlpD
MLVALVCAGVTPAGVGAQPGPVRGGQSGIHQAAVTPDAAAMVPPAEPTSDQQSDFVEPEVTTPLSADDGSRRTASAHGPGPAEPATLPASDGTAGVDMPPAGRMRGSVRPRGRAAPIVLADTVEVTQTRRRRGNAPGARLWPMMSDSFEFSQDFGCVPQLGGFYGTVEGCPAGRPAFHTGIDMAAPRGTRFYAAASGWVIEAGWDRPTGLANTRLLIQHDGANDGYATEYLHWGVAYVKPGQYVRAGQPIGEVGSVGYSTGPHLHFGVVDFSSGARMDPIRWLPRNGSGGKYLGLPPGSVRLRVEEVSLPVPDYADPAPPPVPTAQNVPESPPTEADAAVDDGGAGGQVSEGGGDGGGGGGGGSRQGNGGNRNNGDGRANGSDRDDPPATPEPPVVLPPPVPANPGVPVDSGAGDDDRGKGKGGKKK